MKQEIFTEWENYKDYFISKEAFVIFALTNTDGATRSRLLGIKKSYYLNNKKATEWYNAINSVITDKHPMFCEAHTELNKIYRRMKGKI